MPLSDTQRNALSEARAMFQAIPISFGVAESVEQRARRPVPEALPPDIAVHVEIVPPSSYPDPILSNTGMLKMPERVPVYFYSLGGDRVDGLSSRVANANARVIFFIHGGGNIGGHPTFEPFAQYYVQLLHTLASHSAGTAECVLIAPSYRLATIPENAFPAALQDVLAAYDYILSVGFEPSNIVLAGDSAGGNHAIVLTHLILESGRPCPHGVVAIAPASIQTNDLLSDYAKTLTDVDVCGLPALETMWSAYVGAPGSAVACTDPLVSGSFLPFTSEWPKTLILVGDADVLIDASREIEKRLAALGRPIELVEYDELPHGWWILPHLFPDEIGDSVERIARFLFQ